MEPLNRMGSSLHLISNPIPNLTVVAPVQYIAAYKKIVDSPTAEKLQGGTLTSTPVMITGGCLMPGATVDVEGVPITFTGTGHSRGTDQEDTVGDVGGHQFRSDYYEDRNH